MALSVVVSVPAVNVSAISPQPVIDLRQFWREGHADGHYRALDDVERRSAGGVGAGDPGTSLPDAGVAAEHPRGSSGGGANPADAGRSNVLVSLMTYVLALLGYKA